MEITGITAQTVASNQNMLFSETVTPGNCSIMHREGSGIVKLRGLTNQCRARFKVFFNGNIGIPTSGAVGSISAAIAIDGEPTACTQMLVTPAATGNLFNVSAETYVDVPAGCCSIVSVENTSTASILAQNINLIIERVA